MIWKFEEDRVAAQVSSSLLDRGSKLRGSSPTTLVLLQVNNGTPRTRSQDQDFIQKISEIKTTATRLAEARFNINTQTGSPAYGLCRDRPHVGLSAVTGTFRPHRAP
ncbi:hypothetical protein TNCV_1248941 [Trichonephila clavipes]|nr:hypothetical protein TNCV_1248941 [Trichonephila clavipes]